jgi:hypothetical protein
MPTSAKLGSPAKAEMTQNAGKGSVLLPKRKALQALVSSPKSINDYSKVSPDIVHTGPEKA